MNDYFEGATQQHIERVSVLMSRIRGDLPREFHALAATCRYEGKRILSELEAVLRDPDMRRAENQPERLRAFRRAMTDLSLLEQKGIAALERGKPDTVLNHIVHEIRYETCYPLLAPTICALSQSYFHIYLPFNLMFVPLAEDEFLLHLPDLYHELAHPLINEVPNRSIEPFQNAFFNAYAQVLSYVHEEQQKEDRRGELSPKSFAYYLQVWRKSWGRWLEELFCDLFATLIVGPAYAWSHFYLCAKLAADPFAVATFVKTTHPSDDARMRVILLALEEIGFKEDAARIKKRWNDLLSISGAKPEPEYYRCYPDRVLHHIVHQAIEGTRGIGCRIVAKDQMPPVAALLNQAWQEFWRAPAQFSTWERSAVEHLRKSVLTPKA